MTRSNLWLTLVCAALGLAVTLTRSAQSAPAAEQPFYAGKTIRIISGFAVGGTVDLRARVFARHLPKWIPGNPAIIVQTMAGYKAIIQPREKEGTAAVLWQTGILTSGETFKRSEFIPHIPTLGEILPKAKKTGPAWEAWKAAVVPQAFQTAIGLPPGVPSDRIAILSHALEKMTQDPAYREDHQRVLGQPADALMGEQAVQVVKTALQYLFENYQAGVRYLRELPNK